MNDNKKILCGLGVIAAAVVFAMTPFGCGIISNLTERGYLRHDLMEVLNKQGVQLDKADCNMIGDSREGYCDFVAEPSLIQKIVTSFNLVRLPRYTGFVSLLDPKFKGNATLVTKDLDFDQNYDCHLSQAYLAGSNIECFGGPSPTSEIWPFNYMIVYYDPSTKNASIKTGRGGGP